jgi:hypothetical protein
LIEAKTNVPVAKQRLIFGGSQIQDTAKLSDYGKRIIIKSKNQG